MSGAFVVFEHAFGRAPEQAVEGDAVPQSWEEVGRLSCVQMQILASRLLSEVPMEITATMEPSAAITTAGSADTTGSR